MNESQPNSSDSNESKRPKQANFFMMVPWVIEFAVDIGLPLVIFVLLGKWLETKYHTKLFIIAGIFLALGISTYIIGNKINKIRKNLK